MKPTPFDTHHPLLAITYFVVVLGLCMAAFHPALLLLALIMGTAYNTYLRGWRGALGTCLWQVPLLFVITLLNPFFSPMGSTFVTSILDQPVYLESLAYGACMGCMLMAVMQWFSNAAQVITSDKLMAVTGRFAPVVTLMTTMVGRLVPQFVQRGETINASLDACSAAPRQQGALQKHLRTITTLMGWSMEDSLESSAAMRARGWGATTTRSTYRRIRWRRTDLVLLGVILLLAAASVASAIELCSSFRFYATIQGDLLSPWLIPYAVLLLLPAVLEAIERLRWQPRASTQAKQRPDQRIHPSKPHVTPEGVSLLPHAGERQEGTSR